MRNEITVLTYPVMGNNLIQTKDHDNVSPAQWTSVPTMMYRLRTRLVETLMSTGPELYGDLYGLSDRLCSSRRMPLLRVQTLLQHPLAVSDRSFVPHPRLRRRHRHRSLSKDAHSALRCGRPCDMASDCIGEYAPLFQRAEQVAYLRVQIAHSRIVHPCHTVLISPLLHCPLPQIQRSPIKVYLCRVSWKYVNSIGVFAYFSQQIRLCLSNTLTSNL